MYKCSDMGGWLLGTKRAFRDGANGIRGLQLKGIEKEEN
jgi:hypothetical protein